MAGVDPSFGKSKTYTIVKASFQKKKNKLQNAMVKGLGAAGLGGLHFLIFALSVGLFSVLVKSQLIRKDLDAGKD